MSRRPLCCSSLSSAPTGLRNCLPRCTTGKSKWRYGSPARLLSVLAFCGLTSSRCYQGELHTVPVNVPALNLRISMRSTDFERLSDDGNRSADEEDVVLDRDAVKKESLGMVHMKKNKGQSQSRGKRRKGRSDGGTMNNDDDSDY